MTTDYLSIIQRTRRTPDPEPVSMHSTAMPAPPPPSAGSATDQDPFRPIRTGIKRKRLVLSCLECKRRKLKCDRELPVCKRCRDAGQPDRCKYDERIAFGDDDAQHSSSPSASLPGRTSLSDASAQLGANGQPLNIHERQRLELLERHVASLESRLNIQPGASQSVLALTPPTSIKAVTPDNHVSVAEISNDPEEPMVMRGKKFKTQFYGASHSVSIISYFDEVHDFLKKTVREHPMFCNHKIQHKVRKDIERSQKKEKYKYVCIPPDRIDQHLLDLLPDQATCRHYMEIYFKHFEGLYRIIHRVVFWRQFDKFWSRRMDNAAPFTALLLVAMSCARCLFPDTPLSFEADSTTSRVQAVSWVHAAETWHTYQSKKHTFLENFQVACLILLSKRVNAIKLKQHYAIAQAQAAIAISAGLHRSPYLLGPRNSLYDREMRRRIWAVVAEQELSCSNGRGIPSTLGNIFSDCEAPHNLRDDEFDEETETPPAAAAPDDVFTEMSYTRWMHDVRPLRMTINALVNHPQKHHALSYSELLSYHTQITTRLSTLPRWSLPSNAPQADLDRRWFFERMMELNLHHLLIILHLPYAADRAGGPNAAHSRFICNESARITLSVYEDMPAHGFSGMCITRHHIVRSGLVTCLLQDPIAASSPLTSPLLHTQSTTLLEKAFSLIEDRILCLGSGFRGYWLLFAASCFLKSHGTSPEGCAEWQRKITERIIAIFGKICMSQVSEGTPGFSLADAAETAELYKRHVRGADWRDVGEEGMGARAQWERDGFGAALGRRGSAGGAGPAGGAGGAGGVGAGTQAVDGAGTAVGAAAEGSAGGMGGAVAQTDMGSGGSTWMGSNGGLGVGVGEIDWADWTLDDFGFYSLGDA